MEGPPTVSTEGGDQGMDEIDIEDSNNNKKTYDASLTKPTDGPSSSSSSSSRRRRSRYLTAAVVGLVVIVAIIVVLSLSLTGAFDGGGSSSASAVSSPESSGGSSGNSSATSDPAEPVPSANTTSPSTPAHSNSSQSDGGGDGSSEPSTGTGDGSPPKNSTSDSGTDNGQEGGGGGGGGDGSTTDKEEPNAATSGAQYPTDPYELLDIWSGDAANATSLTFENGETVFVRWPECVGMDPSGCESRVRETNPYVNDVFVLGPFDYSTDEFRNDRVKIRTDEDYAAVVEVPTIG